MYYSLILGVAWLVSECSSYWFWRPPASSLRPQSEHVLLLNQWELTTAHTKVASWLWGKKEYQSCYKAIVFLTVQFTQLA